MSKLSFLAVVRRSLASLALLAVVAPSSALPVKDPMGSAAAPIASAREIRITPATKAVNVERYETVRFVNAAGQSFTWHFYTLHHPTIELRQIAPPGFTEAGTLIYVSLGAAEYH